MGRASMYVKHTTYEEEVLPTRGAAAESDQQGAPREQAKCQYTGWSPESHGFTSLCLSQAMKTVVGACSAVHSLLHSAALACTHRPLVIPVLISLSLRWGRDGAVCKRVYWSHRVQGSVSRITPAPSGQETRIHEFRVWRGEQHWEPIEIWIYQSKRIRIIQGDFLAPATLRSNPGGGAQAGIGHG